MPSTREKHLHKVSCFALSAKTLGTMWALEMGILWDNVGECGHNVGECVDNLGRMWRKCGDGDNRENA